MIIMIIVIIVVAKQTLVMIQNGRLGLRRVLGPAALAPCRPPGRRGGRRESCCTYCTCVCIYIYIYIYTYTHNMYVYLCVYIYIYIHTQYVYIYIYVCCPAQRRPPRSGSWTSFIAAPREFLDWEHDAENNEITEYT